MKKILIILIMALFAMSVVYGQVTTETFHVSDKKILSAGSEKDYLYIIDTVENGDIIVSPQDYSKIRIDDTITIELSELSYVRKLVNINGQPV